ncbi:M16 family metallopeptidase [Yunchengibacter salinarum]|uniref:M16 family metallopeptidase n=1 Tax=Yunchengibacter salinarum TaxID=3133399 RepID=UPI0035B630D1
MSDDRVRLTRLPGGLRIISEQRPALETVSVGVWVDAGSRLEGPREQGITHCLEHMLFKGTERRSARDIALEIEAVGGQMNAFTSRDQTLYYCRVLKDDMGLAVDLLGDILTRSVFDPAELTREKEVILQELAQAVETPDDIIFDHLQEAAYGDQPLGHNILGTPETVGGFTRDDLNLYMAERYQAGRMVVSAVGNLDHDRLVALVAEALADVPPGDGGPTPPGVFTGGRKLDSRPLEQVHLTLGWPGVSYFDADYYPAQVFTTLLGGGMSSRLFQTVREERGLAYAIFSFANAHRDTGMSGLYAAAAPEAAAEVLALVRAEVEDLARGPGAEEVASSINQLKAGLMMALESTTSRMEQLGRQLLVFDRVVTVEEILKDVTSVTPDDVARMARDLLDSKTHAFAAVGAGDLPSLDV